MVSAEDRKKIKEKMKSGATLDNATKEVLSEKVFSVNQKAAPVAVNTQNETVTDAPEITTEQRQQIARLNKVFGTYYEPSQAILEQIPNSEVLTDEDRAELFIIEYRPQIKEAMEQYTHQLGEKSDYWRTKGKPQEWRGLCGYIGHEVFCNKKLLRCRPYDKIPNTPIISNNDCAYDMHLVNALYGFFSLLCSSVGLPCKWGDFALFANIPYDSLVQIEKRLTPEDNGLIQKAWREQGESIAAAAEGSRIQPVVALARLNAFHGWTKQTEIYHATQAERKSTEQIAAEMGVIE